MVTCDAIKRSGFVTGLLAAGLAMSACATSGTGDEVQNGDPIAELTTGDGTTVSFYEPVPGSIGVSQQLPMGMAPLATAGKSAVALYQSLAPGQPVPQALLGAQARADQARSDRPASQVTAKAVPSGGTESFTSDWFETNHCYENDGVFWHFINCHADPLATASLDGTHIDIDEFRVDACADTASITLRVWIEGDQKLGIQLKPGHCEWYHWVSGLSNADSFESSATVTSAGDYGLAVKWNN
jgi:hypothetical protein